MRYKILRLPPERHRSNCFEVGKYYETSENQAHRLNFFIIWLKSGPFHEWFYEKDLITEKEEFAKVFQDKVDKLLE